MKPVKRDQIWEVLRGGGEWCEAHVINVVSNRVNLHFGNPEKRTSFRPHGRVRCECVQLLQQ
jgi:hypothetical protein